MVVRPFGTQMEVPFSGCGGGQAVRHGWAWEITGGSSVGCGQPSQVALELSGQGPLLTAGNW